MERTALRKGISYMTNDKGQKTAIVVDLKNKALREIMEDLIDTIDAAATYGEPTRTLEEVKRDVLAKRTKANVL